MRLYCTTQAAFNYYEASCKMMDLRIENKMKNTTEEDIITDKLDEIWNNANGLELKEIEDLPRRWWFQHIKNGLPMSESELDIYPYARHFIAQNPYLTGDDISHLKGKPYFFNHQWKSNQPVFYFCIQQTYTEGEGLEIVGMSNEHYDELQNNFDYLRHTGTLPTFKKKTT